MQPATKFLIISLAIVFTLTIGAVGIVLLAKPPQEAGATAGNDPWAECKPIREWFRKYGTDAEIVEWRSRELGKGRGHLSDAVAVSFMVRSRNPHGTLVVYFDTVYLKPDGTISPALPNGPPSHLR